MHLQGPSFCRRGEQIGLRTLLINNEEYEMFVIIILHGSSEYKFVHVEEGGYVSSYGARLSEGEHQHLVYVSLKFISILNTLSDCNLTNFSFVLTAVATQISATSGCPHNSSYRTRKDISEGHSFHPSGHTRS